MNLYIHILYVHIQVLKTQSEVVLRSAFKSPLMASLLPKQTNKSISRKRVKNYNMFSVISLIISITFGLTRDVKSEFLVKERIFLVLIILACVGGWQHRSKHSTVCVDFQNVSQYQAADQHEPCGNRQFRPSGRKFKVQ